MTTTAHEDQFTVHPDDMTADNKQISRELLAKIVTEVFDDCCEDTDVIEEIYAVIMREQCEAGEPVALGRDGLTDLIAEHLSGTYHCTRVWSAWGVGTMSQDDFEDVGESDTPAEIADAIIARYAAPQASAEAADESRCANCGKPASQSEECISECPEEGEWFCSDRCYEQHGILDCPHETHIGYRHPAESARLIAAEEALKSVPGAESSQGIPGSVDANDREAWHADMIAAGATHLGGDFWEWEQENFAYALWKVAIERQQRGGDALHSLVAEKFASGNSIPVERITVTRQEYEVAIAQQREGEGEGDEHGNG